MSQSDRQKDQRLRIAVETVALFAWLNNNPDILEAVVALGLAERDRKTAERMAMDAIGSVS